MCSFVPTALAAQNALAESAPAGGKIPASNSPAEWFPTDTSVAFYKSLGFTQDMKKANWSAHR